MYVRRNRIKMIKTQKIIKYCAIAFAIFLIFNILSVTFYGIMAIGNIFNINNNPISTENLKDLNVKENSENIEIDVKGVNILVKEGTNFKEKLKL